MESAFAQFLSLLLGQRWTITFSLILQVRANLMKRGVGQVRHLDGKLLWVDSRKDFKIVQIPTDSNMADINTKPLQGLRTRYLINLIGYWRSEERTRV